MLPGTTRSMAVVPVLLLLAVPAAPRAAGAATGAPNPPAKAQPAPAPAPAPAGPLIKNPPPAVKRAQDLVLSLEAGTYKGDREALGRSVETAERDLQSYTKRNPGDDAGVLLMMRLYEVGMRSRMYDLSHKGAGFDTTASLGARMALLRDKITAPYHAVLDRALQRSPGNAEFHYWKGRLLALFEPLRSGSRLDPQHSTLPQAIREMRLAASASPAQAKYREGLAALLLANDQEADAIAIYKDLQGGRHPMYLLLRDWAQVKLPAKTAPDPVATASLVQRAQFAGRDYALARCRAYLYPGTSAQFIAECRRRWPGFRLVQGPGVKTGERAGLKTYAQVFAWKGGALAPSAATAKDLARAPKDGLTFNLVEMRAPKSAKPDPQLGVPPGAVYCTVIVENHRSVQGT